MLGYIVKGILNNLLFLIALWSYMRLKKEDWYE